MTKKIAITVQSKNGLTSILDPRFGRASAFLIVDLDLGDVIAELGNENINASHGAGIGTAALMDRNQVDVVISGRFGPKAFQSLGALQIEMWSAPDGVSAGEALDQYRAGTLTRITGATNPGHFGRGMGGGGRGMGGGGGRGMGGGGGRGMGGRGMGGGGMGGGRGRND